MLRQFPEERLDLHGIFIDRHFDGEELLDRQVYIFHHCTGTIRTGLNLEKKLIPMLYLANGCNLRIEGAPGNAVRVPAYTFDGSRVEADDKIKLIIHDKGKA